MTGFLVGLAVWLLMPPSSAARLETIRAANQSADSPAVTAQSRRPSAKLLVSMCCPLLGWLIFDGFLGLFLGLALVPVALHYVDTVSTARARKQQRDVARQLPECLELMAAALQVGKPPVDAFRLVAAATEVPLGPELQQVAHRLQLSADHTLVWSALLGTALEPMARAFLRAENAGIPIASIIRRTAEDARRTRHAERRTAAGSVAVKAAAPLGLCFLPAFFLVAIVPMVIGMFTSFGW